MLIRSLIEFLAPAECLKCGRQGDLICANCIDNLAVTKRPTCYRCNRLSDDGRTCPTCRRYAPLSGVIVGSHYDETVKTVVQAMKYQHASSVAPMLGGIITPLLRLRSVGDFDLVTSVPPSPGRYRQRGYNQAELIARAVSRDLGLPYTRLLGRRGKTRQVGHSRSERLKQVQDAFYVLRPGPAAAGGRVLIIDDVLTTGATLAECARQLKAAGYSPIWGAVVAKH